jgi:hypothetical protein
VRGGQFGSGPYSGGLTRGLNCEWGKAKRARKNEEPTRINREWGTRLAAQRGNREGGGTIGDGEGELDMRRVRAYRQRTLVGTPGASHFSQLTQIERRIPVPYAKSAK